MLDSVIILLHMIIFFIVRLWYNLIQAILWKVTGVTSHLDQTRKGAFYESSVHVLNILWKGHKVHVADCTANEFLTVHEKFAHPDVVLQPDVSLYGLSHTEAIFVQTSKDVNVFSSDTHPFMKMAQFSHARKLYTMPIESLHLLAEKIGEPSISLIWLSNTGRCGSTVLTQVFEKVPGTISMSEPQAITFLTFASKQGTLKKDERDRLLRTVIRVLCKPHPGTQRLLLKPAGFTFAEVEDIYRYFPKSHHLFMYRDNIPYLLSTKALLRSIFMGSVLTFVLDSDAIAKLVPSLRFGMYKDYERVDSEDTVLESIATSMTSTGLMACLWSSNINRYIEFREKKIPIAGVLYEDLVLEKEGMVRSIFAHVDIPEKYTNLALTAFDKDSQRGAPMARSATKDRAELTARDIADSNLVFQSYGLPKCGEKLLIPGLLKPMA